MARKPLLTIGIPAYNVELFIEETVLSVAKSKYSNKIEVLIINDGSSDNTLEVANRLSQTYPCVKVINKPNGGHGSAINSALANATGKYFRLLDGDDWFDTEEFNEYLKRLDTETADIVFTDLVERFIKSNLNRPVTYYSHLPEYQKLNLDDLNFPEWGPMLPTTTIKTDILKKFNLKIDEHCFYVDQEYNIACYLSAKTVTYYPFMIYQYRLEREGQSMEKSSLIKNVKSHEKVCARLLSIFTKHSKTMSASRKNYLSERVVIPMCHMQYAIAIELCKSKSHFLSFDNTLKKYPKFYNNSGITGTLTNFHRKTRGLFIRFDPIIRKIADKKNRIVSQKHNLKRRLLISISCLIPVIIANILVANYVNSEHVIHYWDTSAYWKNSLNLVNSFHENPISGFKEVAKSLNTDYNLLPILPLIPFLSIFGTSRLVFILTILNLYIIPFAIFMTKAIKYAFKKKGHHIKLWLYPLLFTVFTLSPPILIPVLNGRPDAICILIVSLIFYLLAKTRLEYISNYFTLGLLVFVLIVLRRYFCFWAIGLYLAIFITKSIINIHQYHNNKERLNKTLKLTAKLTLSGLLIILLMAIFCNQLLIRYITGGYNDAYSAYMLGDFFNQIVLFIRYYGFIFLTLALIGVILVYYKYRHTTISEITSIGLITSILSFLLFTKVQTLGDQHMYLIAPFLTLSIAVAMTILHNKKKLTILAIAPAAFIIFSSIYSFTGERAISCSAACYTLGISEEIRPIVRHDLSSINELSSDLANYMKPQDYVYTLSSSAIFNDDILQNENLPLRQPFNISGVRHVDKRDGFPFYFFDATYILVANPIQTHLAEGGQDVIVYLAQQILDNKAKNLSLIKTYSLDNNVQLNLYHKTSQYDSSFLESTKTYFKTKYPNYPNLYETIPLEDTLENKL